MRILHFAPYYPPHRVGGVGEVARVREHFGLEGQLAGYLTCYTELRTPR